LRSVYIFENLVITQQHGIDLVQQSRDFPLPYQTKVLGLMAWLHTRDAVDPEAHRLIVERIADVLENWGQLEDEEQIMMTIANRLYDEGAVHFHRERLEHIRDNHPTLYLRLHMETVLENDRRRRR